MSSCTHCNLKWKAKDIWKLVISRKGRNCPNCKTKQYASFKDSGILRGLGYVSGTIALIIILLFPFLTKLSDTKDVDIL